MVSGGPWFQPDDVEVCDSVISATLNTSIASGVGADTPGLMGTAEAGASLSQSTSPNGYGASNLGYSSGHVAPTDSIQAQAVESFWPLTPDGADRVYFPFFWLTPPDGATGYEFEGGDPNGTVLGWHIQGWIEAGAPGDSNSTGECRLAADIPPGSDGPHPDWWAPAQLGAMTLLASGSPTTPVFADFTIDQPSAYLVFCCQGLRVGAEPNVEDTWPSAYFYGTEGGAHTFDPISICFTMRPPVMRWLFPGAPPLRQRQRDRHRMRQKTSRQRTIRQHAYR